MPIDAIYSPVNVNDHDLKQIATAFSSAGMHSEKTGMHSEKAYSKPLGF